MEHPDIEDLTSEIRKATAQPGPPVDLMAIAKEEGILLAPGNYGDEFDGRIEFHRGPGRFILFYPERRLGRSQRRIRFSVAHELGHYYIPSHRDLLVMGQSHYSKSGFICDNRLEREADFFAAALLLPRTVLKDFCLRKEFYTLKEIVELANEWETSITSAAIRYVQWTPECCGLVLSQDNQIRFYIASDDAAHRGFEWLGRKEVPARTETIKAGCQQGSGQVFEGRSHTETWFSYRRASCKVWEEAFPLGYTRLVLTMLTLEVEDVDD